LLNKQALEADIPERVVETLLYHQISSQLLATDLRQLQTKGGRRGHCNISSVVCHSVQTEKKEGKNDIYASAQSSRRILVTYENAALFAHCESLRK